MQKKIESDNNAKSLVKSLQKIDDYGIFKEYFKSVFMFTGNTFRSDDGVGPYIADKLSNLLHEHPFIHLINAQSNPENYINEIITISPKFVVFIDAARFEGKPGEFLFIDDETNLPKNSASTHTIPLNLIAALIRAECNCTTVYIGIQAGNLQLGEKLSKDVKKAADLFTQEIKFRIKGT